jgi:hypothetical protein
LALPLFSVTLFVSAFLLFLVQPIMGKLILPKLGGTPQVWNTCMLFFQSVLLAGYAYTHTSGTQLKLKTQLVVHIILLALALPLFLLIPTESWFIIQWAPAVDIAPVVATLSVLLISIGVPFFVVSTSAPLLQKWFAHTGDPAAKDPYFLYGASNLGSLLSLLMYPFLIEPFLPVIGQRYMLVIFYVLLAVLIIACALRVWSVPAMELHLAGSGAAVAEAPAPAPVATPETASTAVRPGPAPARAVARKKGVRGPARFDGSHGAAETPAHAEPARPDEMTAWRRIRWTLLAAVPSSLMLGVTSYISVDLSPFPLLWVIPLALYLTTFIIVYMKVWTGSDAGQSLSLHSDGPFSPHRFIIFFLMPLSIIALTVILLRGSFDPFWSTLALLAAFFCVALGCHGELARDRPTTRHLTEYYLLMSFGGMLGGVFNGLVAPVVFPGVWEFPIAIVLAALVRPQLADSGWTDDALMNSSPSFQEWARQQGEDTYHYIMDVLLGLSVFVLACFLAWFMGDRERLTGILKFLGLLRSTWGNAAQLGLLFGVPLIISFFFSGRPLRFAIALGGIILCNQYIFNERYSGENLRYAGRSYFGVLRVLEEEERLKGGPVRYTYLMHGTTYHGRNYIASKQLDLSRLSTTYYHRFGPVGLAMEQYNWFPGPQNTFWADARMPCSQIGQVVAGLGVSNLPIPLLVDTWSEPPYATIGLGTGTMASYARPYQSLTYYEIDEKIRHMSLPIDTDVNRDPPFFTYLLGALQRGADLEVIMGDARLTMEREDARNTIVPQLVKEGKSELIKLAEAPVPADRVNFYGRDRFYKVINVDAFSSDAIPVHLITKQAIQLYLSKMTDDGVLCVHTSNRHLNLVKPVSRIVDALNADAKQGDSPRYSVMVGKDTDRRQQDGPLGHFSSEYVMIFREDNKQFDDYIRKAQTNQLNKYYDSVVEWYDPIQKKEVSSSVWTDDYSNLVSVIRWPWTRH